MTVEVSTQVNMKSCCTKLLILFSYQDSKDLNKRFISAARRAGAAQQRLRWHLHLDLWETSEHHIYKWALQNSPGNTTDCIQVLELLPVPSVTAVCQWLKAQQSTAYSPGSSMTSQPTNLLTERRLWASRRPSARTPELSKETRNTNTHRSNRWLSAVSQRLRTQEEFTLYISLKSSVDLHSGSLTCTLFSLDATTWDKCDNKKGFIGFADERLIFWAMWPNRSIKREKRIRPVKHLCLVSKLENADG